MKWEFYNRASEASKACADMIIRDVKGNPRCKMCLPTGSTPIQCLEYMVEAYEKKELDLSEVTSFNMDEYVGLEKTHDQSYYYFLNEYLYKKTNIKLENTHCLNAVAEDLQQECNRYTKLIQEHGGFDTIFLGIGSDGHISFNMPNQGLHRFTHIEELSEETIEANSRFFDSMDEVPKQALTIGIEIILRSKNIVLLALGAGKA